MPDVPTRLDLPDLIVERLAGRPDVIGEPPTIRLAPSVRAALDRTTRRADTPLVVLNDGTQIDRALFDRLTEAIRVLPPGPITVSQIERLPNSWRVVFEAEPPRFVIDLPGTS